MKGMILALALALGAVEMGCVKTGTATETQAFSGDMASYKSASIEVEVPGGINNSEQVKSQLQSAIIVKLRESQVFADFPPTGGDVTLKVKVDSVEAGNKAIQAISTTNGGDAEVHATVQLVDTKQSKVVGAFDVTGNSKQNGSMSVGGVNTKAMGDTTQDALNRAAEQINDYLVKHRK